MNKKLIIILILLFATMAMSAQVDKALEAKITAFTKAKFPDDKKARKKAFTQQVEAYNALTTVEDIEALTIAREKYADDYYMQKYVYDQQVEGKRFMGLVDDADAKLLAVSQYPDDFHMQKYVYQRNLEARGIDPTPKTPVAAPVQASVPMTALQPAQPAPQATQVPVRQTRVQTQPTQAPVQSTLPVVKTVAKQASQVASAPVTPKKTSFVPAAVTDKIKSLVQEYFPDDKDLQKEVYDAQVSAFQFLFDEASDKDLRDVLFKKYPYDFVAQKNEYVSTKGNEVAVP